MKSFLWLRQIPNVNCPLRFKDFATDPIVLAMFASNYRRVSRSKDPFDTDTLPLSEFPADHARLSSPRSSRSSSRTSIERNNAMESCDKVIADALPQLEHSGICSILEKCCRGTKIFQGSSSSPPPSQGLRDTSPQTTVVFSLKKFRELLLPGLASWLVSLLLMGAFFATVSLFQQQVMSPRKKSLFDTITTILSLALGLNIASSLRAIYLNLRWWILTIEKRPAREVCMFLN